MSESETLSLHLVQIIVFSLLGFVTILLCARFRWLQCWRNWSAALAFVPFFNFRRSQMVVSVEIVVDNFFLAHSSYSSRDFADFDHVTPPFSVLSR